MQSGKKQPSIDMTFRIFEGMQKIKNGSRSIESELDKLRNENNYLKRQLAIHEETQKNLEKNILALLNTQNIDSKQGEPAEQQPRPCFHK